ncbi:aminoglycoside N(3)-acetyltransferase [Actinoplanes sp. NPDC020271]|uniref:aminoglycoside N(3)-acetyltransferase n=1 Tax=Actinoplanes sp. NPDC020271 TaxID=3363896 RepID=UPI0037905CF7
MPSARFQTRQTIAAALRALGVPRGGVLLVHSSLSSIGWVSGGSVAVVQALLDVLGPDGTLVVPSLTTPNRDPSRWDPPPPESWWQDIRDSLPGFDPAITPSSNVGVITEQVRTWPGAVRSVHPQTSFAALGPRAAELMAGHRPDCHYGEESPLARLEKAGAWTLLLGVGFCRTTAFHLAEYRIPGAGTRTYGCAVLDADGERRWIEYQDVSLDDGDFALLGADFERAAGHVIARGLVGTASCRLFPIADAAAYAEKWLAAHR